MSEEPVSLSDHRKNLDPLALNDDFAIRELGTALPGKCSEVDTKDFDLISDIKNVCEETGNNADPNEGDFGSTNISEEVKKEEIFKEECNDYNMPLEDCPEGNGGEVPKVGCEAGAGQMTAEDRLSTDVKFSPSESESVPTNRMSEGSTSPNSSPQQNSFKEEFSLPPTVAEEVMTNIPDTYSKEVTEDLNLTGDREIPVCHAVSEETGNLPELDFSGHRMPREMKKEIQFEEECKNSNILFVDCTKVKKEDIPIGGHNTSVKEIYIKDRILADLQINSPQNEVFSSDRFFGTNSSSASTASIGSQSKIFSEAHTHSCSICGKSFARKYSLVRHAKVHAGDRPFPCTVCRSSFVNSSDLLRHELVHLGAHPFCCGTCGKSFKRKSELARHEKWHIEFRPFSCELCGKSFVDKGNLTQHEKTHSNARPYSCRICGKSFVRKYVLFIHERIHKGVCPFSCSSCAKTFPTKSDFLKHEVTHLSIRPYSCNTCAKSFKRKSELVRHERAHARIFSFSCDVCGKSYIEKSSLSKHVTTHLDIRPYSCHICGKSFARNYAFLTHVRKHSGVCPFSCNHCGKLFVVKSNLLNHERKHADIQQFSCDVCGRTYSFKRSLLEHVKKHL